MQSCLVFGTTAVLVRRIQSVTFTHIFCSDAFKEDAKAGHTRAAIFTPFLQLLAPEVPSAVKLSIIGSIQRMCVHMTDAADSAAHSATIKASCFDLIEDPDYDVRMAFR